MPRSITYHIILCLILILAQVLICNHILLFGVAVPVVYIFLLLRLPISMSKAAVLTIGFLLGAVLDLFSDTAGVNALSCCVLAMLRRPVFYLYMDHDEENEAIVPSIGAMGLWTYIKYLLTISLIFFTVSMSVVFFTFVHLSELGIRIVSSTLLTSLIIIGIDSLLISKSDKKI